MEKYNKKMKMKNTNGRSCECDLEQLQRLEVRHFCPALVGLAKEGASRLRNRRKERIERIIRNPCCKKEPQREERRGRGGSEYSSMGLED